MSRSSDSILTALKLFSLAAVVSATASSVSRADLIINGGFEDPGTTPGTLTSYVGGSTIGTSGWTVTGSEVNVLNTTYAETGITFNAHSGNNALDLTGNGNSGFSDGVTQVINTSSGQKYTVEFYLGRADDRGASGNYNSPPTINLTVTGINQLYSQNFTNGRFNFNGVDWLRFQIEFTADSSSTRISFKNATPPVSALGTNYAGLDDVSVRLVRAVPEPSSLICLCLGGLGLVGVTLRRRKASGK